MGTTEAEQIVTRFVAAWERHDVDELLDYFSEDAVWVRGPMKPVIGKPALREAISTEWFGAVTHLGAEIHAQVSDGKTVMHERIPHRRQARVAHRVIAGHAARWMRAGAVPPACASISRHG
jgi:uncharacterized protein (TIGR02246 family)